jgi:hemolysin activation/secretion protein
MLFNMRRIASVLACAALAVPSGVMAQASSADAPSRPALKAVVLMGQLPLPPSQVQSRVATWIGQPVDQILLDQVRQAVAKAFDDAGWGLVQVEPPYMQGDIALVRVQSLRLGRVLVAEGHDQALAEATLPELQPGQSPNLQRLDRQIRLANLQPQQRWAVDFRPIEPAAPVPNNAVDAQVEQSGSGALFGAVMADNAGQAATGRERLQLQLGRANALGPGRTLGLSATVSASAPQRQHQWALSYQHPVPSWATLFSVQASQSRSYPGIVSGFFDVSGDASSLRLSARQMLLRRGAWEPYMEVALEPTLSNDVVDFFGVNLGNKVGAAPLTVAWGIGLQDVTWNASGQLGLIHNPGWGPHASASEYGAARFGATPTWSKLDLGLDARRTLGSGRELAMRLQAQWSADALVATQRFGVGGAALLRGLQEGELTGDSGLALGLEYGWVIVPGHRLAAQLDWGWAQRHLPQTGEASQVEASTLGLSWMWAPAPAFQINTTAGIVMAAQNLPVSKARDTRLHMALRWAF